MHALVMTTGKDVEVDFRILVGFIIFAIVMYPVGKLFENTTDDSESISGWDGTDGY